MRRRALARPAAHDGAADDERIPVHVLTGFLGSGKTTVLNRVLRAPAMQGTLVIVNEFGEVGLDHLLIERPRDETILLANGCMCCTVLGDLMTTLAHLLARREAGDIRPFDRIVIETTGLAHPAPILRTVVADPFVAARCRMDGIVAVFDGCNGFATLETHDEARKQIAVADTVIVSKTDRLAEGALKKTIRRLQALNRGATVAGNDISDRSLAGMFLAGNGCRYADAPEVPSGHSHGAAATHPDAGETRLNTFALWHGEPVAADAFRLWLNAITRFRGSRLLRMKGLANVDGVPVLIQAVQDVVHEPVALAEWPSDDRRTRIVFITDGLERDEIAATFSAFSFRGPAAEGGPLAFSAADYARFVAAVRRFGPMERV